MQLGAAGSLATTTLRGLSRWFANRADSNQFTDAQVDGLLNRALHQMQLWILQAYKGYEWTATTANTNLVAGTNNYAFPTDFVQIVKIEVNYSGNTDDYHEAKIVDLRDINQSLVNLEDTGDRVSAGVATVYVFNNRLYLLKTPGTAVTNGIRVYYTQIQTELSGTTDEPGFPEHFHKMLSLMAAIDYGLPLNLVYVPTLKQELLLAKQDMEKYYGDRIANERTRIVPLKQGYE